MMYGLYNDYGGWGVGNMMGSLGGGIMMILFWAVVILFFVWVVREVSGGNDRGKTHSKSALDILKERYAKGEIDKKEFEEKKKDLTD